MEAGPLTAQISRLIRWEMGSILLGWKKFWRAFPALSEHYQNRD
jgi:hypothetical protein